jgi:hypothetical protein
MIALISAVLVVFKVFATLCVISLILLVVAHFNVVCSCVLGEFKSKITWSSLLLTLLAISFISLLLFIISSLLIFNSFSIDFNSSLSASVNLGHFQITDCFSLFSKAQYLIILLSLGLLITLTAL